jgi:hypothetical protein
LSREGAARAQEPGAMPADFFLYRNLARQNQDFVILFQFVIKITSTNAI